MLISLILAALLGGTPAPAPANTPPELEALVSAFVDGLRRDDRLAVRGLRPLQNSLGTSYDRLHLFDNIDIEWYRIAAVEPGPASTMLTVEMEGSAIAGHSGEHMPWSRWWSIEAVQIEGKWVVGTAMTLERRFGADHIKNLPPDLDTLLRQYPGFDPELYTISLATHAMDLSREGCDTVLWLLRESVRTGRADVESYVYQILSWFAALEPVDAAAALLTAERGVLLAEADRRPDTQAEAFYTLGGAHLAAGRIDEALAAFRRASSYQPHTFDPRTANRSLNTAIDVEIARNNLRIALADAELYQSRLGRLSSQHDRMLAAFQIGVIHDRLGNIDISRRHYEMALVLANAKHDPTWQASLAYHLAMHAATMGDADEAHRLLKESRAAVESAIDWALVVKVRTALAASHRDRGDFEEAETIFEEALNPPEPVAPQELAQVFVQRSLLRLGQGRFDEALADARMAHKKAGTPRADALTAEAQALRALKRFEAAEEALRTAIDVVELDLSQRPLDDTGRAVVLQQQSAPYRELLDLLVEQNCAREALTIAERMRARSLRDSLRNGRIDLSAGLDDTKRAREGELEAAIAAANKRLLVAENDDEIARVTRERDEARVALRRFRSELYVQHPELDRRRPETSEQYETWRPYVASDEIVLELAVNIDSTYLFVLEGENVEVHRLNIRREELEKHIDAFVTGLEQRDLAYRKPAQVLYEVLLGRVAPRLAQAKSIRIVPDGALWRLPFHALIDERGQHLIERLPVSYSPSLALTRTPVRRRAPQTLLAFGDPAIRAKTADATRAIYRDVNLGRLPDAATEARAIGRLYADSQVRVGAEAREMVFKEAAPGFRVLHLATHSIVDNVAPMFSSIVLASSDANPLEDGLLEVREIADLKLHADLAVLSACETARGTVAAGEGMVGLSWAFLTAGVPTTVVSQWKVGSASTAGLMIDFHRKLRDGAGPSEALRAAMLGLREDSRWRHPFYWAPFVVIENSGPATERQ